MPLRIIAPSQHEVGAGLVQYIIVGKILACIFKQVICVVFYVGKDICWEGILYM